MLVNSSASSMVPAAPLLWPASTHTERADVPQFAAPAGLSAAEAGDVAQTTAPTPSARAEAVAMTARRMLNRPLTLSMSVPSDEIRLLTDGRYSRRVESCHSRPWYWRRAAGL